MVLTLLGAGPGSPEPIAPPSSVLTAVTLLGDVTASITDPVTASIGIPLNGAAIRLEASGLDLSTVDLSKITITVSDPCWRDGVQSTQQRTLWPQARIRKPYNEGTTYTDNPAGGVVELVLTEEVFNEGPGLRTEIVSIALEPDWITGHPGGTWSGTPVRLDSLPYHAPSFRMLSAPYQRDTGAGVPNLEIVCADRFARGGRAVYSVAAWQHLGGVDGDKARTTAEVRSLWTPAVGYNPSGLAAPVFRVTAPHMAGVSDGFGEIRWEVEPWIGPVWTSADLGDAFFPSVSPTAWLPFVRDVAGEYAPVYAWVNADGVAGASPAVQTTDTDPGAAASYATLAAARTAIQAWMNANRAHNTSEGGVIMLRAVSGSVAGSGAGGYAVRASMGTTGYGLIPVEIRAAGGAPTDEIRLCGVLQDNTTQSTSRQVGPRIKWVGVTFDGCGQSAALNQVIDVLGAGHTSQPTEAAAAVQIFQDCKGYSTTSSTGIIRRAGFRWEYRNDFDTFRGAGAVGCENPGHFDGLVAATGNRYARAAPNTVFGYGALVGCKGLGYKWQQTDAGAAPDIRDTMHVHCYLSNTGASVATIGHGGTRELHGFVLRGCTVRLCSGATQSVWISADAARKPRSRIVLQANTLDGWFASDPTGGQGRINFNYDDKIGPVIADAAFQYNAVPVFASKNDYTAEPDLIQSSNDGQFSSASAYHQAAIVYDTATQDAATTYYVALQPVPTGSSLSDTTYWRNLGQIFGQAFGQQSTRVGTYKSRHFVNGRGNVIATSLSGLTAAGPTAIDRDVDSFGGVYGTDWNSLFIDRSTPTVLEAGDYSPAAGSELLNKVPAWLATGPFDHNGVPIPNDGTGASGAWQVAA